MDIKTRIDALTEEEAKGALAWILETMEDWHIGCINDIGVNCPLWMRCGEGENHCPNAWLDEALKETKHDRVREGMETTKELNPCPRCKGTSLGHTFLPIPFEENKHWAICCDECHHLGKFAKSLEEAGQLWNQEMKKTEVAKQEGGG